jgi:hypothetical protein
MALLIHTWDIPPDPTGREEYRLIGQEAIIIVLRQPGVRELRAYRNPLRATPQVMVQIEFDTDEALQRYLDSHTYGEILRDFIRVGCRNIRSEVWAASPLVPRPLDPGDGP